MTNDRRIEHTLRLNEKDKKVLKNYTTSVIPVAVSATENHEATMLKPIIDNSVIEEITKGLV